MTLPVSQKTHMTPLISVIIPNFNGAASIGACLESVFSSDYPDFEVIVVDDHSDDGSADIIRQFPCLLITLEKHCGAAAARNAGAAKSNGQILFFTDADCVLTRPCLRETYHTLLSEGPETIVGGTYLRRSYDNRFFSRFQSVFINYSETKHLSHPDYIATHAMGIFTNTFINSCGFRENWFPILEDVEYSHRLRSQGYRLVMNPRILVQHIFNYSLKNSMTNAIKKSSYWTAYSIANKDLLSDSGTASRELKTNVSLFYLTLLTVAALVLTGHIVLFALSSLLISINVLINRHLFKAFYDTYGMRFSVLCVAYYMWIYPLPVGLGGLIGITRHIQAPHTLMVKK